MASRVTEISGSVKNSPGWDWHLGGEKYYGTIGHKFGSIHYLYTVEICQSKLVGYEAIGVITRRGFESDKISIGLLVEQ